MSGKVADEKRIFYAAREIRDGAKRAACLDQACAGDAALRSGGDVLAEASETPGSFMQRYQDTMWKRRIHEPILR